MLRNRKDYIATAITCAMAVFILATPGRADETVTINLPVKLQSIMDGVTANVYCHVSEGSSGNDKDLGHADKDVPLVNGSADTTVTLTISPHAGKTFATAVVYGCILRLMKGGETAQSFVFNKPTGGPEDWKYAKPNTDLRSSYYDNLSSN